LSRQDAKTSDRGLADRLIQYIRPRLVAGFAPAPIAVAPDLWSIDRRYRLPGGLRLPTRATVIRLSSGGLLVVSPPPVEAGGLEQLDALGAVEEVLVPNSFHYLGAAAFSARYPRAALRLAPGLHARVAGLRGDELGETPASWGCLVEPLVLGPVRGIAEVALFHRPSATLILTDVAFNMTRFESGLDRLLWRLNGVPADFGPSRTARQFLLRDRAAARAFVAGVLTWPFERVLVAHGEPLAADAVATFRRAFSAYL